MDRDVKLSANNPFLQKRFAMEFYLKILGILRHHRAPDGSRWAFVDLLKNGIEAPETPKTSLQSNVGYR